MVFLSAIHPRKLSGSQLMKLSTLIFVTCWASPLIASPIPGLKNRPHAIPSRVAIVVVTINQPITFPPHFVIFLASPIFAKDDAMENSTSTGTNMLSRRVKIFPRGASMETDSPMVLPRITPTTTASSRVTAK